MQMETRRKKEKKKLTIKMCLFLGLLLGVVIGVIHFIIKVRRTEARMIAAAKGNKTVEEREAEKFEKLKKKALRNLNRTPGNANMLLLWTVSRINNTNYLRTNIEEKTETEVSNTLNSILAEYKNYQQKYNNSDGITARIAARKERVKEKEAAAKKGKTKITAKTKETPIVPSPILVNSLVLALQGNESVKYMLTVSPNHRELLSKKGITDKKGIPLLTEKGTENMLQWLLGDQPKIITVYLTSICDKIEEVSNQELQKILRRIVEILIRLISITPPKMSMDRHLGKDLTLPSFLSEMKTRIELILAYETDKKKLEELKTKQKQNSNSNSNSNKTKKEKEKEKKEKELLERIEKKLNLQEKMAESDHKTPNEKTIGLISKDLLEILIAVTSLISDCFKSTAKTHRDYVNELLGIDNELQFKLLFMFPALFFAPNRKKEGNWKNTYMYMHGLETVRSTIKKKKNNGNIQTGEKERLKQLKKNLGIIQTRMLRAPNKATGLLLYELDVTLRKFDSNGPSIGSTVSSIGSSESGIKRCIEELVWIRDLKKETVNIEDLLGKSLRTIREETAIDLVLLMDIQKLISEHPTKPKNQSMEDTNGEPVFDKHMSLSTKKDLVRNITDLFVSQTMRFKKQWVSTHLGIDLQAAESE